MAVLRYEIIVAQPYLFSNYSIKNDQVYFVIMINIMRI